MINSSLRKETCNLRHSMPLCHIVHISRVIAFLISYATYECTGVCGVCGCGCVWCVCWHSYECVFTCECVSDKLRRLRLHACSFKYTHMIESCHICERVTSYIYMFTYLHIYKYVHHFSRVNALKMNVTDYSECVWVMSRMNESCRIWMGHVTYKWVMSRFRIRMSCATYEGVMSHMNESYHIWN